MAIGMDMVMHVDDVRSLCQAGRERYGPCQRADTHIYMHADAHAHVYPQPVLAFMSMSMPVSMSVSMIMSLPMSMFRCVCLHAHAHAHPHAHACSRRACAGKLPRCRSGVLLFGLAVGVPG